MIIITKKIIVTNLKITKISKYNKMSKNIEKPTLTKENNIENSKFLPH